MSATTHPRALKRSMRVIGTLLLTLSAITPASSVFVAMPELIKHVGSGAFLSMAAAGLMAVPIAYVYAELASVFPIAGGEYAMVGRTAGAAAGFATLGLAIGSNVLTPALLAVGASAYLKDVVPDLDPVAVAIAIVATTTVFGILHIRTNAWVTGAFLALELLALAAIAVLGFLDVKRPLWELVTHPMLAGHDGGLVATPAASIGSATSIAIFAYSGFGSAVYFAEEMHEARRLITRTIMWALAITVVSELVPLTAMLLGAPDLKTLLTAEQPFGEFVSTTAGHALRVVIDLSVAVAILNAVLATVMQNARFFYSTGRDGAWHPRLNDAFMVTHERFNSPWIATLLSGLASVALCLLGRDWLLLIIGNGTALIYGAICVAAIAGRRTGATARAAYRTPLYPLWPVLGLAGVACVCISDLIIDSDGWRSLLINAGMAVVAVGYYVLVVRRKKDFAFRDPHSAGNA